MQLAFLIIVLNCKQRPLSKSAEVPAAATSPYTIAAQKHRRGWGGANPED
jgi:hypothetical protein